MVQSSVELSFIISGVSRAIPSPSKERLTSLQFATGEVLSITLIIELHLDSLPLKSVTINAAGTVPINAQSRLGRAMPNIIAPQLSVDPRSKSSALSVKIDSEETVIVAAQIAIGGIVSPTNTSTEHTLVKPVLSVTTKV